ncbi:MAG: asparagine synthase-related protein [Conexivisphaerales archaeon]
MKIKPAQMFLLNLCDGKGEVDGKGVDAKAEPLVFWADSVKRKVLSLKRLDFFHIASMMTDMGDYCVAGFEGGKGFALTDKLGSRPVFFLENGMAVSNRVALLGKYGPDRIKFLPGSSLIVCGMEGVEVKKIDTEESLPEYSLEEALELSVKERVQESRKVAVAFSGGLDSSLIAFLAKKMTEVALFTLKVGEGEGKDELAERSSQLLDAELHYVQADEQLLMQSFKSSTSSVLWKSVMDYSIALGFQIVAQKAREEGYTFLLAGQGADELFGGYRKYLVREKDEKSLLSLLSKDVAMLYVGAARDAEAIRDGGCIPSFPYMDERVALLAENLPLSMKVRNGIGKSALRISAMKLGLAESICSVPKKAFQYSSGMQKLVMKVFF